MKKYEVNVPTTKESGNLLARRIIFRIRGDEEFEEERTNALFIEPIGSGTGPGIIVPNSPSGSKHNVQEFNRSEDRSSRQISNDIAMRFTRESLQFCGDASECWPKHIHSYIRMGFELEMTNEQMVKYFHHLLRDDALEVF